MLKNQKGVTLVALVVTIVVLLILAAVSITLVVGNNGLIKYAQNASKETTNAKANELTMINETINLISNETK